MKTEIKYLNALNPRHYSVGDIVHWVDPYTYKMDWGIIEDVFSDGYGVKLYELKDMRTIDGIPVGEFQFNQRRQKLPKGWSYDTKLFELGSLPYPVWAVEYLKTHGSFSNDSIETFIKEGLLVTPSSQDKTGYPEADINKDGWTIVWKYDFFDKSRSDYASVQTLWCFPTAEDAQKVIDAHTAELKRQAELSEYDWSVEQIDKTINRCTWIDDDKKARIREFLLRQKNVEDIETRLHSGGVQWRYWKNKRWMLVEA